MFTFFMVIHVIVCVSLILVVLLQSGRGGGLAGAFGGGGGGQAFFGSRGAATFLGKATAWLAIAFMVMSILLAVLSSRTGGTAGGLLQERARRNAPVSLPPSTSALDPSTALDSLDQLIPDAGISEPADTTGSAAGNGSE